MKLESIAIPQVAFDPRLDAINVFSDVFGSLTHDEWNGVLINSITASNIEGVEFPTFPPVELQNRIHGHDGVASLNEAAAFYKFACDNKIAGPDSPKYQTGSMLDYGSGWGRIVRHFMRDFPLRQIVGYEPSNLFATIARANNPYVTFLSGGYMPDGILPAQKFDLAVGWSVFSHLPKSSAEAWLAETARVLTSGGAAMYTTWGMRFLERLKAEEALMKAGEEIHWYSKVCLLGAGDIDERFKAYEAGEFVWFNSLQNSQYGEAFISQVALERMIKVNDLPLTVEVFDDQTLGQDVFILRRL
jgi:ubiquinone/menaquinone biosynthesis C-methylase UbiE